MLCVFLQVSLRIILLLIAKIINDFSLIKAKICIEKYLIIKYTLTNEVEVIKWVLGKYVNKRQKKMCLQIIIHIFVNVNICT